MKTLYTVQRCSFNKNKFYGYVHGSHDGDETVCGLSIINSDPKDWYILDNTFEGEITCPKCKDILRGAKQLEIPFPDSTDKERQKWTKEASLV